MLKKNGSLFKIIVSGVSLAVLAGCGGDSLASSKTTSRVASVSGGQVNVGLSSETNGSVSDATVGLVAYATGIDQTRGQIVAAAGIADNPTVGETVTTDGVVTYSTSYNYQIVDDVTRSDTFISGERASRVFDGQTTLTADFGTGQLTGSTTDLDVNGTINGQNVGGNVVVNYNIATSIFSTSSVTGSIDADLTGQIGSTGVIGAFSGSDSNTVVAGGLVGTAN
ncbi:hypothetical protein Q4555_16070 [Octadecabacter sp. 1_MG-2023]|uniref:hypothetical protein n=1 Tax=unclassified Octadecabacter TaxID=196158 RepID=UPI001C092E50|nr:MULTISPECIES: hypothetical protein [unclassified Octadecabacter]MBU2991668.1 hypothetical protein [Octadecabacter sp. B2R22]MDO6736194.1 hypothetical protein [Octadecabacter sp. 1_MG-2023]